MPYNIVASSQSQVKKSWVILSNRLYRTLTIPSGQITSFTCCSVACKNSNECGQWSMKIGNTVFTGLRPVWLSMITATMCCQAPRRLSKPAGNCCCTIKSSRKGWIILCPCSWDLEDDYGTSVRVHDGPILLDAGVVVPVHNWHARHLS